MNRLALLILAAALLLGAALLFRETPGAAAPSVTQRSMTRSAESVEIDLARPEAFTARPLKREQIAVPEVRRERNKGETVRLEDSAILHVRVTEGVHRARERLVRAVLRDDDGPTTVTYEGRTDGDAEVSFVVPPESSFDLFALAADGDWSEPRHVDSPVAGRQRYVKLRLPHVRPTETMTLRVRSMPSGAPLAGATVSCKWSDGAELPLSPSRVDGRGTIVVPWDRALDYAMEADGHAAAKLDAPRELPEEDLPVDVYAHARLHGVTATPGAIEVVTERIRRSGLQERLKTRTAEDGRWSIDDLEVHPDGAPLEVVLVSLQAKNAQRVLSRRFTIAAGQTREVEDPWNDARSLTVVLRYPDGVAVAAGLAANLGPVTSPDVEPSRRASKLAAGTTDGLGRIEFGPVPEGSYVVRVGTASARIRELRSADGRLLGFSSFSDAPDPPPAFGTEAEVEHDGRSVPTVVLDARAPVSGVVVDAAGVRRADAVVSLRIDDELDAIAQTDADGAFHLHLVPLDETLELCASMPLDEEGPIVEVRPGDRDVVLTLPDK
ncbi:MAG: hypothetical protein AAF726_07650 [Planctomycetota bacterium]